jgi:hypothetical protein
MTLRTWPGLAGIRCLYASGLRDCPKFVVYKSMNPPDEALFREELGVVAKCVRVPSAVEEGADGQATSSARGLSNRIPISRSRTVSRNPGIEAPRSASRKPPPRPA